MNDTGMEDEKFSNKELRYLVFALLSEQHRQRELLAYIAAELGDEDKVDELLARQTEGQYVLPFEWLS